MSNKSPFGSASDFANIGSWKAGSPASNPGFERTIKNHQKKPRARFLAPGENFQFGQFSRAKSFGPKLQTEDSQLVERTATLGDLKLLVGSECLEFQKGMAAMDALNE